MQNVLTCLNVSLLILCFQVLCVNGSSSFYRGSGSGLEGKPVATRGSPENHKSGSESPEPTERTHLHPKLGIYINRDPETGEVYEKSRCKIPPETGSCQTFRRRWYFDFARKQCRLFVYSGCKGNGNRFPKKADCVQTCLPETNIKENELKLSVRHAEKALSKETFNKQKRPDEKAVEAENDEKSEAQKVEAPKTEETTTDGADLSVLTDLNVNKDFPWFN